MLDQQIQQQLKTIWDNSEAAGHRIVDRKGFEYNDLDGSRRESIKDIKEIIAAFMEDRFAIAEFKTNLDSYNKQHNYWGFTAAKGQMFFNLITRSSEGNIENYVPMLKNAISEPVSLEDALANMKTVFDYASKFQQQASDKRFVANPMSSAYFLSYFWQIHNNEQWPIMYSSIIVAFEKLGIWQPQSTSYDNYRIFFSLNEEIKQLLSTYTGRNISNWQVEHALWNFSGTVTVNSKSPQPKKDRTPAIDKSIGIPADTDASSPAIIEKPVLEAGFELSDYLIPKVSRLFELGAAADKSSATKGRDFERGVGETFRLLDFDVEFLGQGTGREPDAIIKYPSEHIAFLVDAKAYSNGYSLGTDDRAIREYINYYCPKLKQAGFNKIGFIIVSNSFKSDLKELINEITWTTDIKRFLLLTTEALLHLVAYKTKDKIHVTQIVEKLIAFESTITKEMILEEFGDY